MSRVVATVGAIPGAGVTTLVSALGSALAEQRSHVALVDASAEGSRIAEVLSLDGDGVVADALRRRADLAEVQSSGPHGLVAFPAAPETNWTAVRPGAVATVYEQLRDRFELTLVDCGSDLTPASAAWIGYADELVAVSCPDVAGAASDVAALGSAYDVPVRGIVANRVVPDERTETLEALETSPHQPLALLPEDSAVDAAATQRQSILVHEPDSQFATCTWEFAQRFRESDHADLVLPDTWGGLENDTGGAVGSTTPDGGTELGSPATESAAGGARADAADGRPTASDTPADGVSDAPADGVSDAPADGASNTPADGASAHATASSDDASRETAASSDGGLGNQARQDSDSSSGDQSLETGTTGTSTAGSESTTESEPTGETDSTAATDSSGDGGSGFEWSSSEDLDSASDEFGTDDEFGTNDDVDAGSSGDGDAGRADAADTPTSLGSEIGADLASERTEDVSKRTDDAPERTDDGAKRTGGTSNGVGDTASDDGDDAGSTAGDGAGASGGDGATLSDDEDAEISDEDIEEVFKETMQQVKEDRDATEGQSGSEESDDDDSVLGGFMGS